MPSRALSPRPKFVQILIFAVGIHGEKEAFVAVGHQLTIGRQAFQGLTFQHAFVAFQIIENAALEHKETGAGPSLRLRFFGEVRYTIVGVQLRNAEARDRAHSGDGRQFSVRAMEFEQCADIDIRQPVAVGQHEGVRHRRNGPRACSRPPVIVSRPVSARHTLKSCLRDACCEIAPFAGCRGRS